MSDIFREVEEDVRRERLEQIWKQYGDYIVAAVALLILAAAAVRLWMVYEARQTAAASDRYLTAEQLSESGQYRAASQEFAGLARTAPSGYAKLAQLQEANAFVAADNKPAALAIYRKLVDDGDAMLSAIARVRAAWLMVDGAPKGDVQSLLQPLTAPGDAWQPVAQEVLAYADYRAGATQEALKEFQGLAKNAKAPSGVRGRSRAMATFLAAGGERNVGNVPVPTAPNFAAAALKANGPQGAATAGQSAPAPSAKGSAPYPAAPASTPPAAGPQAHSPAANTPQGRPPK